jgi:TolA-binding protein
MIIRTTPSFLSVALFAAMLAPAALCQKANDVVVKKDGARLRGVEITEFAYTGLKVKKGSDTVDVPAHQVLSVEWGDLPEGFIAGRAAMERGDYANAAQMFGEAERQTDRPLVKADALFFQFKAAIAGLGTDKGAASTAADKAKSWLAANATHWRLPEALLLTGRALRLAGNGTEAATTLRGLDDRAASDGFGAVWSARAKFELAMTLLADGKAAEARSAFQSASASADSALNTPSSEDGELRMLKTQAKVGEGETFLGEKQWSKAESFFHNLAGNKEPELVAAGRAGEGEALFMSASENNNIEGIRRAQIALATASVMDSTSGEASAKANYYLGKCLLALGPDREGDTFKARAAAYFQIVATNYPTSRWATAAKAELAK